MTVIKINAITVDPSSGDELAHRFAARAGAVEGQEGFEGFELLKPTDDRHVWLVVTRWRDEESFEAWASSPSFGRPTWTSLASTGSNVGALPAGSAFKAAMLRLCARSASRLKNKGRTRG